MCASPYLKREGCKRDRQTTKGELKGGGVQTGSPFGLVRPDLSFLPLGISRLFGVFPILAFPLSPHDET